MLSDVLFFPLRRRAGDVAPSPGPESQSLKRPGSSPAPRSRRSPNRPAFSGPMKAAKREHGGRDVRQMSLSQIGECRPSFRCHKTPRRSYPYPAQVIDKVGLLS